MERSKDRILTTHVGSLPRPDALIELMFAKAEGKPVDAALLERKTQEAVREVVAHQREVGIDVVSDGEMSKPSYATYVTDRLTGFGGVSNLPKLSDILEFPNVSKAYFNDEGVKSLNKHRPACNGPVASKGTADAESDIAHFGQALEQNPPVEAFMNAASPGVVSMFLGNTYYPTEDEFLYAVADAMKPEYEAIVNAGFLLQLDCPDLAMTRHREFANAPVEDFRDYAKKHIEVLNYVLDGLPRERIRVHICWGNYPGPHHHDVPMHEIIDLLLGIHTGALLFEAANSRHAHEWRAWEGVTLPDSMIIIPGVIESMSNRIEHPELVAERIVRFASLVGRENVIAGSDCGFGTFVGLDLVDPAIAWAKLDSLAEGARLASEQLW
jgi:5-methyltetrahydropteroyltriglutamate--homocysteine methyltransferase